MTDLPELPETAQTHIRSIIEIARSEVERARTCMNIAAEATGPTRGQHLADARATVRKATNLLFNAYGQEYLLANRPDFLRLLPAICLEVERNISCQELVKIVREAASEQKGKWTCRMSLEAAVSNPRLWHNLSDEFATLVKDEMAGIRGRLRLFATGAYKPGDGDIGYWWLTNGPRDGVRARFDALAKRAGIALVPPQGKQPRNYRDYWLHCLSLYLSVNDSPHLTQGEDGEHNKSYMMRNLPEASEAFASRLEECALENEQSEKAISTVDSPRLETGKPTAASAETKNRRRELIKRYRNEHGMTMPDLARHARMCVTAIQGMVRGDRSRYSEEKLSKFLITIGVPADQW